MATLVERISAALQSVGASIKGLQSSKYDKAGGAVSGKATFGGGIGSLNLGGNIKARTEGGFWQYSDGTPEKGWPASPGWQHLLSLTHSSMDYYYAFQLSASFTRNDYFYARSTAAGSLTDANEPWRELAHDFNMHRMPVRPHHGRTAQLANVLADIDNQLYRFGFIGDGASHPISATQWFNGVNVSGYNLEQWKTLVPQIKALTDQIDGVAIQALVNSRGAKATLVVLPPGCDARVSRPTQTKDSGYFAMTGLASTLRLVGSAACLILHGVLAADADALEAAAGPAVGPIAITGVEFVNESSNPAARPISLYYNVPGAGRGKQVTVRNCGMHKFPRGAAFTNVSRGLDMNNCVVFGQDYVMHTGGAIELNATSDFVGGCFSYTFHNCLLANYEWGFKARYGSALEGIRIESCSAYNGFGFLQVLPLGAGDYRSLMWILVNCDFEGIGIALDLHRVEEFSCQYGFWIIAGKRGARAWPDGYVSNGDEIRLVNIRQSIGVELVSMYMVAAGFGDAEPNRTNFVFVNVDNLSSLVRIAHNMVKCDHAVPPCLFRLSGSKANTTVEWDTRITYLWGDQIPVVLYSGTGEQPYQVSQWDAHRVGATVSEKGAYHFSGIGVYSTDANGFITIPLPKRSDAIAGGVIPFILTDKIRAGATLENNGIYGGNAALRSRTSTQLVFQVQGVGENFTTAVNWWCDAV